MVRTMETTSFTKFLRHPLSFLVLWTSVLSLHVHSQDTGCFYLSISLTNSSHSTVTDHSSDLQDQVGCQCQDEQTFNESFVGNISNPVASFCDEALLSANYNLVRVDNISCSNSSLQVYSNTELTNKLEVLNEHLEIFQAVLDRTIVGVFLHNETNRQKCLLSYKKWLCTTNLYLYSAIENLNCCSTNNTIVQLRPCLSVCHEVLQQCPYYLPSKVQCPTQNINVSTYGSICDDVRGLEEVIYGGYPAFDCPSKEVISTKQLDKSDYSTCGGCCIEGSDAQCLVASMASVLIAVSSSVLLVLRL